MIYGLLESSQSTDSKYVLTLSIRQLLLPILRLTFWLFLILFWWHWGLILVAHEQDQSLLMNHTRCYGNPTEIMDVFNLQKRFKLHVCVCVCVFEQM